MFASNRSVALIFVAISLTAACGGDDSSVVKGPSGGGGSAGSDSTGSGGSSGANASGGAGAAGTAAGGGGSSGSAGSAVSDAGTTADAKADAPTTPSTCPANAILCDDFEGVAPGMGNSPWTIEVDNTNPDMTTHGKVTLTTDKPAHGTHSVHIVVPEKAAGDPAGGSPAFLAETKTFPMLAGELWGRMMIWYKPTSKMPDSHWVNIATKGAAPNDGQQLRFGGSGGAKLNSNELPSDIFATSATTIPVSKWACFEWHLKSGATASMNFYLDGQELTDMAVKDGKGPGDNTVKWNSVPFAKLELGWQYWNGAFGGEMWLDDVAIGDQRMTCPTP